MSLPSIFFLWLLYFSSKTPIRFLFVSLIFSLKFCLSIHFEKIHITAVETFFYNRHFCPVTSLNQPGINISHLFPYQLAFSSFLYIIFICNLLIFVCNFRLCLNFIKILKYNFSSLISSPGKCQFHFWNILFTVPVSSVLPTCHSVVGLCSGQWSLRSILTSFWYDYWDNYGHIHTIIITSWVAFSTIFSVFSSFLVLLENGCSNSSTNGEGSPLRILSYVGSHCH